MGRKVFVSVLGMGRGGKYDVCKYGNREDGFECETEFIQEATLRYLTSKGEEWKPDKVVILLTDKAREMTWKDLEPRIRKLGITEDIEGVSIADGKSVSEIWENFTILFDKLQEGDQLFFDLTHGFRYLPMLVLTVGNYARFLKNTVVRSITYGSLEGKDADGLAPIIDLLPLSDIQDWSFAAGEYVLTGSAERLSALCNDIIVPRLQGKVKPGRELFAQKNFSDDLGRIVRERRTCRGLDILRSHSLAKLRQDLSLVKKELIPAYSPIIESVERDIAGFYPEKDVRNLFLSAEWCFQRGLYQQAITQLQEGMVTKYCLDWGLNEIRDRELVCAAFELANNPSIPGEDLSRRIAASMDLETVNLYHGLKRLRNDINHCGFRGEEGQIDKPLKSPDIPRMIEGILPRLRSFFMDEAICRQPAAPVFINLSNHPYSTWSEDQLEAARQYGELNYLEFPAVNPEWDDNDISDAAGKLIREIREMAPDPEAATLHIMGEMTLTYSLVETFKALGYRCVASTTERHSWTDEQGNKVTSFRFVRFREY
jgi:CRISPR-associated Csx2 family protein